MAVVYKEGSRGAVVKQIQKVAGAYADGVWGPVTTECVKAWQKAHHLSPDGIVGAKTLAAMGLSAVAGAVTPARKDECPHGDIVLRKSRRRIDYIVVHCTATPEGMAKTVEDIRREHKKQGWSDIGYHYVVTLDGEVHEGRNVDIAGSHVAGYNANSIGVVYVGGLERDPKKTYQQLRAKDTRTDRQKMALLALLMDLRRLYPDARILGHRDFPRVTKACPSFNAMAEYRNV